MPRLGGDGAPVGAPGQGVLGLAVGVAHPHGGGEGGRVADEPGIAEVLARARLARGRAADVGTGSRAARDDTAQDVGDVVGDGLVEHPLRLAGGVVLQHMAASVLDLDDGRGRVLQAPGREHAEGGGHVQGRDVGRAERDAVAESLPVHVGAVRVHRGDAEAVGQLGRRLHADVLDELGEHRVDGVPGARA